MCTTVVFIQKYFFMKESEMRETVEKSKAIKAYKEVKQPYKLLCTSYYKLNIHRYIL